VTQLGVGTRDSGVPLAATVRGVGKRYGNLSVLRGVDLDVPSGRVTALLGPSGCGKTTLLRVLAGFDRVDAGTVTVGGVPVDAPDRFVPPRRRRIGYVPQEGALFPHLSVADNVGFGVARRQRARRTGEMLELIGLSGMADRRPGELSGGQQQRVALARALAVEPLLVLLDEPFSALDAGLRTQVRTDILALLRASGATALLVTHDQEEALSVADQVAVLDHGRIAQAGTPQQIYNSPTNVAVAAFIGSGTLLPATSQDGDVDCVLGRLAATHHAPDGTGNVLVRSDQLILTAPDGAGAPGRVVGRAYYGHDMVVDVELNGGQLLKARHYGPAVPDVGSRLAVTVNGPVLFLPG
jgi:iron(III) transport system ATP-binding protein